MVMLHAINILSDNGTGISGTCGPRIQECWEFEHPRKEIVVDERGKPKVHYMEVVEAVNRINPKCKACR